MAIEYFESDITIDGKLVVYSVPNSTGTLLTYNPTTKVVGTRTNSEIISDLSLMTTNTYQTTSAKKVFSGAEGNSYTGASIMINGNGNANTIYPTLAFHQPTLYASTLSFRGDGFHFMNLNGDNYETVKANGFLKDGSDNTKVLLGGGADKLISDFVTTDNWINITGKKWFLTDNGNNWDNNSLRVHGKNGYEAGLTFIRDGIDVGQIIFNGYTFQMQTSDGVGFKPIKASAFIKSDSDNTKILLGDGSDKLISDFVTTNTGQNILATKNFLTYTGNSWTNNTLTVYSEGVANPSMNFHKANVNVGQLRYYGDGFAFTEGSGGSFVPLRTSAFIKDGSDNTKILLGGGADKLISDFATSSQLGNYLPLSGGTLTGNLDFAETSTVRFLGNEYNNIITFHSSILYQIAVGHEFTWYGERWKAGIRRGADNTSAGFSFEFSLDAGTTYTEKIRFNNDSNISTQNFGSANEWKEAYDRGDFRDFGLGSYTQPYQINIDNPRESGFYSYVHDASTGTTPFGYATILHQAYMGTNEFSQIAIQKGAEGMAFRTDSTPWRKVYHEGNFNPSNKVENIELAYGIGFTNGNADLAPYILHTTAGYRFLATQTWVNSQLQNYYNKNETLNLFVGINGVQTIYDTKTFNISPIVPNATLSNHAVNLGQLQGGLTKSFVQTVTNTVYDLKSTARFTTIVVKGGNDFAITHFDVGMTVKVINPTPNAGIITINDTIFTQLAKEACVEYFRDEDGDIWRIGAGLVDLVS